MKIGDYHRANQGARTCARSFITGAKSPLIFDLAPVMFALAGVLVVMCRVARTLIVTPAQGLSQVINSIRGVPRCEKVFLSSLTICKVGAP